MNDWSAEAAERYGFKVENARKGRGAWILETDRGLKLLKEYKGSVKRLEFEAMVLTALDGAESLKADRYERNTEGEILSVAGDGTRYIVKDWYWDRECDLKDAREILTAVRQIAVLHKLLRTVEEKEEWNLRSMISPPLFEAMDRHNKELKKARAFIRGKRKKNEFELAVIGTFDTFAGQAREAKAGMEALFSKSEDALRSRYFICHGELNQHHLLMGGDYVAVTEFNKMHLGLQVEDLYSFLRKVMEKHGWNEGLGYSVLEAYERILPMSREERECLYYLFLYPEKYWKQINFYYNASKAWIPARNIEKLQNLEIQQECRNLFLSHLKP